MPCSAMEPEVVGRKAEERSESEASPAQTNLDRVVDFMSSMETKRPDVLRRTSAWQAIRAVALSDVTAVNADGLFAQSVVTQHITQFWSHSWHGSKRQKVCTLLLVNNGLAALGAGTCAAVLTAFFLSAATEQTVEGPTETTLQGQYHRIYATSRPQAIACNLSGLLVAILLLLLWRPGTSVFLDRVCVHQSDRELKLAGLVSMSAFLKQSEVLTVWWDATYSSRLLGRCWARFWDSLARWCFELQASAMFLQRVGRFHLETCTVTNGSYIYIYIYSFIFYLIFIYLLHYIYIYIYIDIIHNWLAGWHCCRLGH